MSHEKVRLSAPNRFPRWILCGMALICLFAGICIAAAEKLVGTKPAEWEVSHWMNSPALKLGDLRGRVVLVRWWTAPDCPYCRATAPALNEFYEQYHGQGLEVVGFYRHKSEEPLNVKTVKSEAD